VAGNDPYDDEQARTGERDPGPQTGARPLVIGCLILALGGLAVIGVFIWFQVKPPAAPPAEPDENWDRLVGTWELRDTAGRRCVFEFGADRSYRRVGFDTAGKRIEETGRVVKYELKNPQPGGPERVYALEVEFKGKEGGPTAVTITLDESGQLRGPGVIGSYRRK
jgi:hypothetical protein